ncbi:MAG TPA: aldehyde ferredoxin oxidoreductase C-terminal domain-containing protein [Anaerolineae bacterium]|nr:aldehyde ferredoxin oxidoreductase C-terminal domain-containing protein [Anaerolineae bacterium]
MRDAEARRLLILDAKRQSYRLRLLRPMALEQDPEDNYLLLSGEALCHYLLREDAETLVVARGSMPFLSGNKTTVGYVSPLTGLPHYSFVGGRGFAELLNLGLDAIVLSGVTRHEPHAGTAHEAHMAVPGEDVYVVVSGRAPHVRVEWKSASDLPAGQRSAYYWLLEQELGGAAERGSVFAIGEGVRGYMRHGERNAYRSANLAVDGLYHAGRGGAGEVFARFVAALVLRGEPAHWQEWFGSRAEAFRALQEGEIRERLETCTERLSRRDGGTVTKLLVTGSGERPTLPARNAQRLGYKLADLGARQVLKSSRVGQTGCQWCQVNCRHWHWVGADYAPEGRDRLLDDFEPTYSIFAMLDLQPDEDSTRGRLRLLEKVDQRVILPIEQMGCDVIDVGLGLAALFEGLERGLIPTKDVPEFLRNEARLGDLHLVAQAVEALRAGEAAPALQAVGDGPQALAERYPAVQGILFTSGPGTLGNAGHANRLWTFLMPFSRYFGHYVGQLYKIEEDLPAATDFEGIRLLCERVVGQALQREFFGILGNTLSMCAFTFAIFSQEGRGIALDESDLLVRTLACYGIDTNREELEWFAEAFWAQSIAFKLACGWQPPGAGDYPVRVFEALAQALDRPMDELRDLMDQLIAEWKRQAGEVLCKYGYETTAGFSSINQ